MLWSIAAVALAGYGDPVAGHPMPAGRQVLLWTNAARVDPEAFEGDYQSGGCSFYSDFNATEQTPKVPLRMDPGLVEAAEVHTEDMFLNNWFSHTSSDGTDFATRVWSYYGGWAIAENIAWGSAHVPRSAVLEGWMCSSGHRANIMDATYEDGGGGFVGVPGDWYATLDLGYSAATLPPIRVGAHDPELPSTSVSLYADWGDAVAPDVYEVVLDGVAVPLSLLWGAPESGIYGVEGQGVTSGVCHEYWFRAEVGGVEHRWPETGSYGWGPCAFDDVDAGWIASQLAASPPAPPPTLSQTAWVAGANVTLTADGAAPNGTVYFVRGTTVGAGPCPAPLGGLCLDVAGSVKLLGSATADASGVAELTLTVPANAPVGATITTQAVVGTAAGWVLTDVLTDTIQ